MKPKHEIRENPRSSVTLSFGFGGLFAVLAAIFQASELEVLRLIALAEKFKTISLRRNLMGKLKLCNMAELTR